MASKLFTFTGWREPGAQPGAFSLAFSSPGLQPSPCGVACAPEPLVQQLPKLPRATGLQVLSARLREPPPSALTFCRHTQTLPHTTIPSVPAPQQCLPSLHGTQAHTDPSQPDPALAGFPTVIAEPSAPWVMQVQPTPQQQPHPPPAANAAFAAAPTTQTPQPPAG